MRLSKLYAFENIGKLIDACSMQEGGGIVVTDEDYDIMETWDEEMQENLASITDDELLAWDTALGKVDLDAFIFTAFTKDNWTDEEYKNDLPYKNWVSVFGQEPLKTMESKLLQYWN